MDVTIVWLAATQVRCSLVQSGLKALCPHTHHGVPQWKCSASGNPLSYVVNELMHRPIRYTIYVAGFDYWRQP